MADTAFEKIVSDLRTWAEAKLESIRVLMLDLTRTEDERDSARAARDTALQEIARLETALADCVGQTEPTPDPDENPDTDPGTPTGDGLWANAAEIKNTPTHYTDKNGQRQILPEWDAVLDRANDNWQPPAFFLNAQAGTQALAGLIAYIVTGDGRYLTKVLNHIHRMIDTPDNATVQIGDSTKPFFTRTLELGRYYQTWVYIADLLNQLGVNWRKDDFAAHAARMVTKVLPGHSGIFTILESASTQLNNWSGMARSTVVAICLYLRKYGTAGQKAQAETWLPPVLRMFRFFLGDVADPGFQMIPDKHWDYTGWYADGKAKKQPKAGINPRGEKITLIGPDNVTRPYNVSGVNIMDRLRAIIWPTHWMDENMDTGYDSEGGQAIVSTFWLLWRAGLIRPDAGDHALERWNDWLHGLGEAASNVPVYAPGHTGDDNWINHYVEIILGKKKYPLKLDTTPGKGFGFSLVHRKEGLVA
jgi:hypothetical protein